MTAVHTSAPARRGPYEIGTTVTTRRHGCGVVERYYHAAKNAALSTYAVRIPGRRRPLILYAGEISARRT